MGKNSLSIICKELIEGTGIKAKGRVFSNKTPRRIGISRMENAHVPVEKGMCITSHTYIIIFCSFFFSSFFSNVYILLSGVICAGMQRAMRNIALWILKIDQRAPGPHFGKLYYFKGQESHV